MLLLLFTRVVAMLLVSVHADVLTPDNLLYNSKKNYVHNVQNVGN